MFKYLLEESEQIIYQLAYLLQEKPILTLKQVAQQSAINVRSIERHLTLWLEKNQSSHYLPITLQQQTCYLNDFYFQPIPLILLLYQENETFQILIYLLESPYCSIEELKRAFFCSRSTIKRRLNKIKDFLDCFQLKLSFETKPILSGSEFNLRLLSFITDLINDPPFDFYSKKELLHRIKSIQANRMTAGCSLNHLPPAQLLAKDHQINYQLSERGWLYFWEQLLEKDRSEIIQQMAAYLPAFSQVELRKWLDSLTQLAPYMTPRILISEEIETKSTKKTPLAEILL